MPLTSALSQPYHPLSPLLGGSRELQPGGLTVSTLASLLSKVSITFWRVIYWSPRLIFQTLPVSNDSAQRCNRSVGMHRTWPNHLNLFKFNASSEYWAPGPSTLHPTSEILTKFFHHILLIIQTPKVLTYFVSGGPVLWVTWRAPTLLWLCSRVSCRRHRCFKSVNANRASRLRKDTSSRWDTTTKVTKSVYSPQFFLKNKVWFWTNSVLQQHFYTSKVQNEFQTNVH